MDRLDGRLDRCGSDGMATQQFLLLDYYLIVK